jgi:two-component system, chemotaxis family, sensor kinase CheA
MEIDLEEYRRQFYREARDILERANSGVLKAESDIENGDLLNSIFREVHTIKGAAGSFELFKISEFTHHLEGLLALLRDKQILLNSEIVDVILESLDYIETLLQLSESGDEIELDQTKIESIKKFFNKPETKTEPKEVIEEIKTNPIDLNISEDIKNKLLENLKSNENAFHIKILYSDREFQNGYDPLALLKNIKKKSSYYLSITDKNSVPPFDLYDSTKLYLQPIVYCITSLTKDELNDLAFDADLLKVVELNDFLKPSKSSYEQGTIDISQLDKEMLQEFLTSIDDMHASIEKSFFEYEKTFSKDALNSLFRYIHTIKGDADYIGLKDIVKDVHNLETLLDKLRKEEIQPNTEIIETIYSTIENLYSYLIELNNLLNRKTPLVKLEGRQEEKSQPKTIDELSEFLSKPENEKEAFKEIIRQIFDILPTQLDQLKDNPSLLKNVNRIINTLRVSSENASVRSLSALCRTVMDLINSGSEIDEIIDAIKEIIAFIDGFLNSKPHKLGEILVAENVISSKDLEEALTKQKHIGEILIESGKVTQNDLDKALKKQEATTLGKQIKANSNETSTESTTMKVEESKIDSFYNLIGELIVARNTYDFCLNQIEETNTTTNSIESSIKTLKENLHVISRITNEMQRGVMSLRMVPIKTVFQKYYRVVRDVARKQNKDIELTITGENIEIDKRVADILSDPMVHLIRNACDHGIEHSEDRIKSGKPNTGVITLRASYEGNHAVIRIADDGRGLNLDKILDKANSMGIHTEGLSEDEIYNLIFLPGLSTAEKVTDVSGRGVGMDVVQNTARSLGGFVKIKSKKGKGSETIISIPISMGVSKALIVELNKNDYALPLENVIETLKISPDKIHFIQDRMIFYFRGDVVPLEDLNYLLNSDAEKLSEEIIDNKKQENIEIPVVVLRSASSGRFAVIVDKLKKNMEIAIKPVPKQLAHITVISGVTIMGDGGIVQVLNIEGLR